MMREEKPRPADRDGERGERSERGDRPPRVERPAAEPAGDASAA
jgi:hypothetical protein